MNEKELIASLTRLQRQFLSRRCCAWCDKPLDHVGCSDSSHYCRNDAKAKGCTEETRVKRLKNCLATYKPRNRKGA